MLPPCRFEGTTRLTVLAAALALTACTHLSGEVTLPGFGEGFAPGYLAEAELPDSLSSVPPPPAPGSAAKALDEDIARRSFALRETPRWHFAAADADLKFPAAAGLFSCALGIDVNETATPRLVRLLRRSLTDLGRSTHAAKDRYQRARPFVENGQPQCTPAYTAKLEHDGSYPSGHSAVGWGWALILSELSPAQTDALLARGRSYGESRNVCNVHWHSDVMQGRLVGTGLVARLHSKDEFRADLLAAQAEVAAARKAGLVPTRDCRAEAETLAAQPSLAQ